MSYAMHSYIHVYCIYLYCLLCPLFGFACMWIFLCEAQWTTYKILYGILFSAALHITIWCKLKNIVIIWFLCRPVIHFHLLFVYWFVRSPACRLKRQRRPNRVRAFRTATKTVSLSIIFIFMDWIVLWMEWKYVRDKRPYGIDCQEMTPTQSHEKMNYSFRFLFFHFFLELAAIIYYVRVVHAAFRFYRFCRSHIFATQKRRTSPFTSQKEIVRTIRSRERAIKRRIEIIRHNVQHWVLCAERFERRAHHQFTIERLVCVCVCGKYGRR